MLLAVFCHVRGRGIAGSLADPLITTAHRIGTRAEKRVGGELLTDLKRFAGTPALLFPATGGQTLHDLVAEGAATGPVYCRHLQTVIHNSYRSHCRRMLPLVLDALGLRSNNQTHRPVLDGVVSAARCDAVLEQDGRDRPRVNRTAYEICGRECDAAGSPPRTLGRGRCGVRGGRQAVRRLGPEPDGRPRWQWTEPASIPMNRARLP